MKNAKNGVSATELPTPSPLSTMPAPGFRLEKYQLSAGDVQPSPTAKHHLCMHIGPPVATRRSLDGTTQQRVQRVGDIDIVPSGMAGHWRNEEAFELLLVEIAPAMVAGLGDDPGGTPPLRPALRLRDPQLYHLTLALMADAEEPGPMGQLYRESVMTALLTRLILSQDRAQGTEADMRSRFTPLQQRRLAEFIEENIAAELNLPVLAALTGYGLSRFKTLFRNTFGCAPHAYVLQRRVDHARRLIETGALPLSQIALEAGFSHQSHMASALRRSLGISPGELRRIQGSPANRA
ncbi:MAG: helix-turn-helix domain-containing protein [Rhodomicrobiaceae bacterium]